MRVLCNTSIWRGVAKHSCCGRRSQTIARSQCQALELRALQWSPRVTVSLLLARFSSNCAFIAQFVVFTPKNHVFRTFRCVCSDVRDFSVAAQCLVSCHSVTRVAKTACDDGLTAVSSTARSVNQQRDASHQSSLLLQPRFGDAVDVRRIQRTQRYR